MNDWLDLLPPKDAIPLRAVYGETRPTLQNVEITKFTVRTFGRSLILRINFAEFPAVPPKKWVIKQVDTVEIELRLLGLTSLHIEGISTKKTTNIELSRQGSQIHTRIHDEFTTLHATSDFIVAYNMRAFRKVDQVDPL
jgi:hypothetical protein